jgi:uncharacterized damage-inducible protein DinB
MSFLVSQSQAWDSAFWEFSLAFENLNDTDLWVRPHENLLSIGEITCHVVYCLTMYANKFAPDPFLVSPLAIKQASYYLHNVGSPIQLEMSVSAVLLEVERVQVATKAIFLASTATRDEPLAFDGPGETFGAFADYMIFHVAYHTGQAFSVRHLMGHETNDN